jgi:hypothetical protein
MNRKLIDGIQHVWDVYENGWVSEDDLKEIHAAMARERAIRQTMRETGEPRHIVEDLYDAMTATGEEAVLELTEGEPSTLHDALSRYVERIGEARLIPVMAEALDDLNTLLAYPWKISGAPALEMEYRDDRLFISVGGRVVAMTDRHENWVGLGTVELIVKAVVAAVRG